jgi:AcrR family transcriptional regulator
MRTRKDGEATRENILEAACQVFGEKGYHKATHAEISLKAGVNAALINFHFGSKDELYRAAWDRVEKTVHQLYPMDGRIPEDAPANERLRGHISTLLNVALDPRLGGFHRIISMEMINPTGLLDKAISEYIQKHRSYVQSLIRDLLGPAATERNLELCEMSVMSQCHMILPRHSGR